MTDVLTRAERRTTPRRRLLDTVTSRPALALLPLRAFLGFTFAFAGLQKLADPSFLDASNPRSIQGQLGLVRDASPLRFLLGIVADHAVLFGVAIALTELLVGLATLLGLWQRLAALVGGLVALSFFLTISWRTTPYYYGSDIGFLFAWTPLMILGAPLLSLDAWRLGRPQLGAADAGAEPATHRPAPPTTGHGRRTTTPDPSRRALLATGGVGAAFVLAAGLDAGIGRALRKDGATAATPTPTPNPTRPPRATTTPSHGAGTPSSASPSASASPQPAGTRIAAVSDVPVGSAKIFTDPKSGAPAYVLQPAKGEFRAFSAICSHAGCTVAFVRGSEQFQCPCHGGVYDARTGKVLAGPPPQPLTAIHVQQSGGQLIVPDGG